MPSLHCKFGHFTNWGSSKMPSSAQLTSEGPRWALEWWTWGRKASAFRDLPNAFTVNQCFLPNERLMCNSLTWNATKGLINIHFPFSKETSSMWNHGMWGAEGTRSSLRPIVLWSFPSTTPYFCQLVIVLMLEHSNIQGTHHVLSSYSVSGKLWAASLHCVNIWPPSVSTLWN